MSIEDERGRIPNLMKLGSIPTDMQMDYDTSVLDPVINTQSFCRFVLDNKGFLNSFSKVVIAVDAHATPATNALACLGAGVGVHGLIDRVALRIGTEIVSEIIDYQSYLAYKSMFIDNEINLERETYLTSRVMNHEMFYKDNDNGESSDTSASNYGLSTKMEYTMAVNGEDGNLIVQPELRNVNTSEWSVSVADLIPWLRFNSLPLYLFGSTQIALEIHWTPKASGKRMVVNDGVATGAEFDITTSKLQFYADYIYYPANIMSQFASENSTMNWTYTDFRLNKRSFTGTQLESQQQIRIGGAGRLCSKVISMCEHQATTTTADQRILNQFSSVAPLAIGNNNQVFTTNLIYNNHRLYPVDRTSPAVHFHDVVQTEQNVPQITRGEYSRGGQSNGGLSGERTYNDYIQSHLDEGFEGQFFYIGYRLNRNERVNENGIILQVQYGDLVAGDTYIHRSYIEIVRTATLTNGIFRTDLA
jgi:hypothetical protein